MKTEGAIEINRRIEQVFELTTNHVAEWSSIVVSDESIHQTPEIVGSTFHTVTHNQGKQLHFEGTITHYDPPYANAVFLKGELFDINVAYRFEENYGRTTVTQISIVTGKGAMKLMLFLMGFFMKKTSSESLAKELNNLKQFCENYEQTSDERS